MKTKINSKRYSNMLNIVREKVLMDIKTLLDKHQKVYFRDGILVSGEGFSGGNTVVMGVLKKNDILRLILDDGYSSDFYVTQDSFPTDDLIWVLGMLEEKDYVLSKDEI